MTCYKRQFTEPDALAELARILKRAMTGERVNPRLECAVYECPDCGAWHLTGRPATNLLRYGRS